MNEYTHDDITSLSLVSKTFKVIAEQHIQPYLKARNKYIILVNGKDNKYIKHVYDCVAEKYAIKMLLEEYINNIDEFKLIFKYNYILSNINKSVNEYIDEYIESTNRSRWLEDNISELTKIIEFMKEKADNIIIIKI